jgi:hypothetical protein
VTPVVPLSTPDVAENGPDVARNGHSVPPNAPPAPLNTRGIADSGAALVAASVTALCGLIANGATCGGRLAVVPLAIALGGVVGGSALAYFGKPRTVKT